MHCPACGNDKTTVLETRMLGDKRLRRTRACYCGHKFRTYEMHSFQIDQVKAKASRKAEPDKPTPEKSPARKSTWFPS